MAKVVGIGGVFVKSKDKKALQAWYRDLLGMDVSDWGAMFQSKDGEYSLWSAFDESSEKFVPSDRPFMLNLRVDDLDGLLAKLRAAGADVLDRGEPSEYGTFGYVVDPDGTLLELFQPA